MLSFSSTTNTRERIALKNTRGAPIGQVLDNALQTFTGTAIQAGLGVLKSSLLGTKYVEQSMPDVSRIKYDSVSAPADVLKNNNYVWITNGYKNGTNQLTKQTNYENPLIFNPEIYGVMNTYRKIYKNGVLVPMNGTTVNADGTPKDYLSAEYDGGTLVPSLFNPLYGVQKIGMTRNTPLMDFVKNGSSTMSTDWTDCSIMKLVSLSSKRTSELGQARYKYSDFMYCKDLGMPNNRMITLRKFSQAVGDNIFGAESTKDGSIFETTGDVGHLVTYFDTEENKLEDILNYSFNTTWKHLESNWDQQPSKENDHPSLLGGLLNTMSSQYRDSFLKNTQSGANSIYGWFAGKMNAQSQTWYDTNKLTTNYDQNKVYYPMNTVREQYIPEGKLEFKHEFTLTFVYILRSYDNINPKSAFLDLLGNILATTYTRGRFWGGRNQIIGPQPNVAGWQQAQAIIDNSFDKLGGLLSNLINNGGNFKETLAHEMNALVNQAGEMSKNWIDSAKDMINSGAYKKLLTSSVGMLTDGLKALTQNKLGRPEKYIFNSLLHGNDTGPWHVTIGNPRNPIAAFGNLIMTDAKIQHFGPLGLDDFPSGIKVTVTLKHARPRDMVDIEKMYTRGTMAMYINMQNPSGQSNEQSVHHDTSSPEGILYTGDTNKKRLKRNQQEQG